MITEQDKKVIEAMIKSAVDKSKTEVIHQSRFVAKSLKQRHIDGYIIIPGLAADRPTTGGDVGVFAYWATDTGVLSIWNGTAWLTETLT